MKFFVPCNPPTVTNQTDLKIMTNRHGKSFVGKMQSSNAKAAESVLWALFYPFKPEAPLDGPLKFTLTLVYPPFKSIGSNPTDLYRRTAPDWDNAAKLICDVLGELKFWVNDARVADGRVVQLYSHRPGIGIELRHLREEDLDEFVGLL